MIIKKSRAFGQAELGSRAFGPDLERLAQISSIWPCRRRCAENRSSSSGNRRGAPERSGGAERDYPTLSGESEQSGAGDKRTIFGLNGRSWALNARDPGVAEAKSSRFRVTYFLAGCNTFCQPDILRFALK